MNNKTLIRNILNGSEPAASALMRPELYDSLNAGENGPLPFLGTSTKIKAAEGIGVLTKVLYMQPAKASGREACGGRSKGCTASCLAEYTGHMSYRPARRARRRRHASFYADRARFLSDLAREIARHEKGAIRKGMVAAIRLNGTTDIPWERYAVTHNGTSYPNLMAAFPGVRFYDYTKLALKHRAAKGAIPSNYHLTFSLSEREDADSRAADYIGAGYSVAVVLAAKKGELPELWALGGFGIVSVIDGDKTDARFLDAPGSIVGLSAKGRAKTDTSGFVRAP